jgi:hypothetical protein
MAGPFAGGMLPQVMQRFGQRPQGAPGGLAGAAQAAMGRALPMGSDAGPAAAGAEAQQLPHRGGQGALGVPPGLLQQILGGGGPQGQGGGLAQMLERIRQMPQFQPGAGAGMAPGGQMISETLRPQPAPAGPKPGAGLAGGLAGQMPRPMPMPQIAPEGPGMMGQGAPTMRPMPMPAPMTPPGGGVGMRPGGQTITSSAPRPAAPKPGMRPLPAGMSVNGRRTY